MPSPRQPAAARAPDARPPLAPDARRFAAGFWLACASLFCFFASFYLLMPVIPLYVLEVGGRREQVGMVVGVFSVSSLLLRPPVGWGVDRGARRPYLLAGALAFLASAPLYAVARSVPSLVLLRIVQGAGLAGFTTAANTCVADLAPPARRGEAMGYAGMFINLAMAVAPALGVVLVETRGFVAAFAASAAAALASLVGAALLRETGSPREGARVAWAEAGPALEPALAEEGGRRRTALRGPLVSRAALFPSTVMLLGTTSLGAIITFLPLMTLERHLGSTGGFFSVYAVALIAARLVAGPVSDRRGRGAAILPGLGAMVLGTAAIALAGSRPVLNLGAALFGLGFGAMSPAIQALAVDLAPAAERGAAMATLSAAFDLGVAVGAVALGWTLYAGGFELLFGAAAVLCAGALGLFEAGRRRGL